ncbi:MAG: 1-acyl-sn-glycerol-3-phosphate acyltransferase [Leptospiraceae bacterium]|nr:1-acyl-sn-glycerol-3-phosphate acyltransferase [Leptospiraceae bacterium]MCK6380918.1 1-acyl-sn-glycerol-3-phosphate acyltransferase [Leptospiraceae bacterium]NUM40026.1 1-acyl-sn-glycerol-3-phosphate acyltransferase [Leptospiraceae bacterium]
MIEKPINEKSVAKLSLFYRFVVWLIAFTSRYVFHGIRYYFPDQTKMIQLTHPVVAFANHVDERDVPLLASIHPYLSPKSKYSLPVRRDIMEKNFLIKEFRPKGIAKFIFHIVDVTNVIPKLFKYVGGIPVARPFRDDAKELLRAGKLRDIVNEQWDVLLKGIQKGRKLFLFPEGTLSSDGSIGQIRKGVFFLQERIQNLNLLPFTLTYDFLTDKKPLAHVGFGKMFQLKSGLTEHEVAMELKKALNSYFTLTSGNLFSFAILTEDVRAGIGRHFLFYKMKKLAEELDKKGIIYIAKELLVKSYNELFAEILAKAKQEGFIEFTSEKKYRGTEKLYSMVATDAPNTGKRRLRKVHPYLYHLNQLKGFHDTIVEIWNNIEVYD